MPVGTAETVIVSAMTSPTPGYLPVPFYGDDVTGGGSPARLTTPAARRCTDKDPLSDRLINLDGRCWVG